MNNKLKIGQFSDSFLPVVDGVGRVVYNYCQTLGEKGHETYAIVPMEDMGYRGQYPFEIIDYYSTNVFNTAYNAGIPDIDPHFMKRMETKDFDIIHVHTPFIAGIEGIRYAHKHNKPVVGSFHSKYYDDFLQMTGSKHLANIGTDVIVKFYEACDDVWTVSENSAETLRSYGYNRPIQVIQNGMDIKDIDYSLAIKAKKHFNLGFEPVLLYVGQMNWKKNIERILKACALLNKDGISFQLVLAGKGPHEQEIRKMIQDLGFVDKTTLTGHILDEDLLYGLYALADLFVFPSLYDTYSMVVREAANARTASVVVRNSAPAECIKEGENGFLCEDNDESLYEVMREALKDRDRLIDMGIRAKETIPVSWDVIIDEALERYRYLIENRK
ncbi:MAG: glycosyltransferase [Erysipelotrichaceae bacterium]|nr:glycosyltransferase [Erysipelotrichaceae bacterium]